MVENPITYCMNVHPGEDLPAVRRALEEVTLPVRDALGASALFPIGLRLGATAAVALRAQEEIRRFSAFLARNRLAVIGINGFPYGAFHDCAVKTAVYEPDWLDPRRVRYTCNLFYALSRLPHAAMGGHRPSVTTVPLAYDRGQGLSPCFAAAICEMALFLRKLEGYTGVRMMLALEPEPDCLLESSRTVIDFFEALWRHPDWVSAYRDYIGICFDTCHFTLCYEDPLNALRTLVSANVPIARIQASAALELTQFAKAEDIAPFIDGVYLHQTRRRENDASITCFPDLTPEVLPELAGRRGRVHCHVPLAWEGAGAIGSTRHALTPAFWRYVRAGGWPIEVETYTYSVLPEHLRTRTLSEAILDDIRWVKAQLRNV